MPPQWAAQLHFIHVRLVQLKFPQIHHRWMFTQILMAVQAHIRSASIFTYPNVQRRTPITVPADVPIDEIFQELTEAAFTNMARIPIDFAVVRNQLILTAVVRMNQLSVA